MNPESRSPFHASYWTSWGSTGPIVRPGAPKPMPRTPRHLAERQTITARTFEAHLRLRHVDLIPCPARAHGVECFVCDRVPTGKHRAEVA